MDHVSAIIVDPMDHVSAIIFAGDHGVTLAREDDWFGIVITPHHPKP